MRARISTDRAHHKVVLLQMAVTRCFRWDTWVKAPTDHPISTFSAVKALAKWVVILACRIWEAWETGMLLGRPLEGTCPETMAVNTTSSRIRVTMTVKTTTGVPKTRDVAKTTLRVATLSAATAPRPT